MESTKFLVQNLIDHVDMQRTLENSFKNYHTHGLDYISLFCSTGPNGKFVDGGLTVKLYYLDPFRVRNNQDGYLVHPHNHAYSFSTTVLTGRIRHVVLKDGETDENAVQFHKFIYDSKQPPAERFRYKDMVWLAESSRRIYTPGESYLVNPDDIHSLKVEGAEATYLLLHQFRDVRPTTDFYSRDRQVPSFNGVYERFTKEEILHRLADLGDRLGV